jgi:hypothetical protein
MAQFDDSIPVTMNLPDGDVARLITWAYVLKELNEQLLPSVLALESINTQLSRINTRVDEWLEEQSDD